MATEGDVTIPEANEVEEAVPSEDAPEKSVEGLEDKPDGAGHSSLREIIIGKISRGKSSDDQTFGVSLVTLLDGPRRYSLNIPRSLRVPEVMVLIIDYLLENGMETEHILRRPAEAKELDQIKKVLDSDEDIDLSKFSAECVAGSLKMFLAELPQGLIPEHMNNLLLDCYPDSSENGTSQQSAEGIDNEKLAQNVAILFKDNLEILKYLCSFLLEVTKNKAKTKMDAYALGVCFAPVLFRLPQSLEYITMGKRCSQIIARFITHYKEVFGVEPVELIRLPSQQNQSPSFKRIPAVASCEPSKRRANVWDTSDDGANATLAAENDEPAKDAEADAGSSPPSKKRKHDDDDDPPAKSVRPQIIIDYV